ncbi:MAG: twin-arginine translocation signal domain-containing protein, partial [Pseudomonadota bacterium]
MTSRPFRPTRRDLLAAAPAAAVAGTALAAAAPVPTPRPDDVSTAPAAVPRLSIKASRLAGIAPFGVIFEAETPDDENLLHGEFVWD